MHQDSVIFDAESRQIHCAGNWDILHLPLLQASLNKLILPTAGNIIFNGGAIEKMDTAGAWLLHEWKTRVTNQSLTISFDHFSAQQQELLNFVANKVTIEKPLKLFQSDWLTFIGKKAIQGIYEFRDYLILIGQLSSEVLRIGFKRKHLRGKEIASVIYRSGFQGLPIIALLSILIGVVITYQMGLQLKNYGANIFIVDLLGLSILREFGPLITAIMVAGRTGSAFTAQLGMMKLNQEIDALNTLGVTPSELLLLPRIAGLFIALPLLTMWSDIFGVIGGMLMSNAMLGITWYDFLHRFPFVIPLRALLIGLGKAPVFALIIASIGCFQGMKVQGSADSVGLNTTRSVVLSIFFIIVADALFSVIFSELKL